MGHLVADFLRGGGDDSDGVSGESDLSLSSGTPGQLAALLAAAAAAGVELSPQGAAAAAVRMVVESVAVAWHRLYVPVRQVTAALLMMLQLLRSMQQLPAALRQTVRSALQEHAEAFAGVVQRTVSQRLSGQEPAEADERWVPAAVGEGTGLVLPAVQCLLHGCVNLSLPLLLSCRCIC